jgi:MFS family permease
MYASARYRMWVIFLLFSGTMINAIDRASLSVAAPTIMKELGLNGAQMGLALSAFFWPYLIFNIFAGGIADKFGEKKIMGWAAGIWSVFSALTGIATSQFHLILARIGVGVGESASFPVNAKVVNNNFPSEQRGVATGWYTAGLRLGFSVCPLIMVFLQTRWDWRAAFYVTGLGSLLWVVLWYFTYRQPKLEEPATKGQAAKLPWRKLLGNRAMVGLLLAKFFQDYLLYFFVTWLPGYLVIAHGFTLEQMGTYGSLMWFAGFVNQPLMGFVSDALIRRGLSVTAARKGTIVTVMLLASSVIAVGFTNNFQVCIALLVLAVAFESASGTILWTMCAEVAPRKAAGSVAGIMNTAGALAGILAPSITGLILHFTGNFQNALILAGCMILVAAAIVIFVIPEIKPMELAAFEEDHDHTPAPAGSK